MSPWGEGEGCRYGEEGEESGETVNFVGTCQESLRKGEGGGCRFPFK